MSWHFSWFIENVTKVKDTLNDDGKNALKFLQRILGYDKIENQEERRIVQVIEIILENLQTKEQDEDRPLPNGVKRTAV